MTNLARFAFPLLLVAASPAVVHAQCVDYTQFAHWSGGVVTPGSAHDVALSGTLAYVADGNAGLTIVDVENPSAPFLISTTDVPGSAVGVTMVGDFAYVACGDVGLVTVDVSDPADPVVTQTSPVTGNANTVGSNAGFVYVGSVRVGIDGRLNVFDISFPSDPLLRGVVWTPAEPRELILRGSIVYMTEELIFKFGTLGGLGSYDVSDPDNPIELSYIATGPNTGGDVQDGFGYVCSELFGMWLVDTSDPTDLSLIKNLPQIEARDIAVFRDRAYMTNEGLQIGTISPGVDVLEVIEIPTPPRGFAERIVLDGDRAYLMDNGSLQITRIQTDDTVPEMSDYPTPGIARDLAIHANLAFVADDGDGLQVLDIADPAVPVLLSSTITSDEAMGVAIAGDHAYVANNTAGLTVIDISNPSAPSVVGTAASRGPARAVAVAPPYAYLANHGDAVSRGLEVFDIADPSNPFSVAWIWMPDEAHDVEISDETAYLAISDAGLGRIDITNPESPTLRNFIFLGPSGNAWAFGFAPDHPDGEYGVVTGNDFGLKVIDLAGSGSIIATLPLPGNGRSVGAIGNHVAVGTDNEQVILVSLEEPTQPQVVGSVNARGIVYGIDGGENLHLAQGVGGLGIFPAPCGIAVAIDEPGASSFSLLTSVPNPFRPSTRIPYVVGESGAVSLRVFDAGGRLTRTLVNRIQSSPGAYEAMWDGRDDAGRTAPPGVYFFRLRTPTHSATGKALRLP